MQFELKEIKRRQDAAEEAERKRIQQEQDERDAAEAAAAAKDVHDAPGSPSREPGIIPLNLSLIYSSKRVYGKSNQYSIGFESDHYSIGCSLLIHSHYSHTLYKYTILHTYSLINTKNNSYSLKK